MAVLTAGALGGALAVTPLGGHAGQAPWLEGAPLGAWDSGAGGGAHPEGVREGAHAPVSSAEGQQLLRRLYEQGLRHVDLAPLEQLYGQLDPELRRALPVDVGRFVRTLGQEGLPAPERWVGAGAQLFARELRLNVQLLARVLALATLGALLQQMGRGLGGRGPQEAAGAAVLLALSWLALQSFTVAARMVLEAVEAMGSVAQALIPTLAAISVPAGVSGWAGVAVHPVLLGVVSLAGDLMRRVVVPGLLMGCALGVAGCLSGEFPMSRLARLVQHAALTVLGLCLTGFLGVVAVKGAFGPAADGVTLRTVKFLTGTTVPVVGRMMADAVEVVAGASGLMRSVLGGAGSLLVLLAAAAPALKLLSIIFVFGLAAALFQPVGDPRVHSALGVLAETLGLLLAGLAAATVLSLMAIGAVAGTGAGLVLAR